jgi:cytochrome b561
MRIKSTEHYDRIIRDFHWLTLALLVAVFILAWTIDHLPHEWHSRALQIHKSLGITVMGLTVARLVSRFILGVPGMPKDLPPIQQLAARTTQYALYILLILQPLVGWLWSSAAEARVNYFFLLQLPSLIAPDKQVAKILGNVHGLLGIVLLALIGVHAFAALYHHFFRKDDVLRSMMSGKSRPAQPPSTSSIAREGAQTH